MGRPKLELDGVAILAMRGQGRSIKEISNTLGVSTATLSRRIAELKYKEGLLTKYRELQGLQLTEHQFRILDALSPGKLERASLEDLVRAFAILSKLEKRFPGKESIPRITGLLDYLTELERREGASRLDSRGTDYQRMGSNNKDRGY